MASDFGVDKNKIDNYKHCENVSLKLSIPPHELLNLVSSSTEESSRLFIWLAIEKDYKKKFVSKIDESSFEILLKGRVRGHYNTYAPWLHGQVYPTESGCEVTASFKLNDQMRRFDKAYPVILGVTSLVFLIDAIRKIIIYDQYGMFVAMFVAISFSLSIFVVMRLIFVKSTEKDKEILCHFLMELINPYKIDNESNN